MSEQPRDWIEPKTLIERALAQYILEYAPVGCSPRSQEIQFEALAERAVVVQCEVQHVLPGVDPVGCPNGYTIIDGEFNMPYGPQPYGEFRYEREGIHGREGKAVALILSLEEEKE